MSHVHYRLRPLSNPQIITGMESIWSALGHPKGVKLHAQVGSVQFAGAEMSEVASDARFADLRKNEFLRPDQWTMNWPAGSWVRIEPQGKEGDEVKICVDGVAEHEKPRFVESVCKHLPRLQFDMSSVLGPSLDAFFRKREEMLARLEETYEAIVVRAQQNEAALQQRFADLQASKEEEHRALEARLRQEFEQRQRELDERERELDASDTRSARRKHQLSLKEQLKKRSEDFNLTAATIGKRRPIERACYLVGGVALTILGALLLYALWGGKLDLSLQITKVAAALTFGATVWFYVRWSNQWFTQHANEEFRLKRLALDVDRASWLIEHAMEWHEERNSEIPPALLEHLARNLFIEQTAQQPVPTPTDQAMLSLLGISAHAEVPLPNNGKLELDKKGLQKFGQTE